jgi:hypothetical protein
MNLFGPRFGFFERMSCRKPLQDLDVSCFIECFLERKNSFIFSFARMSVRVCAYVRTNVYRPIHKHRSLNTNLTFNSDIHSFFYHGERRFWVETSSCSARSLSLSLVFCVVGFWSFTNKALIQRDMYCYCKTKLMPTVIWMKTIESCGHAIQHMPLGQWYQLIHSNNSPVIYVLDCLYIAERGRWNGPEPLRIMYS